MRVVPNLAFVRTKKVKGVEYQYLVESVRENGKVKQKILRYLGPVARLRK